MQNPYSPPGAELAAPASELVSISVKSLTRLFRRLVVGSTLIGFYFIGSHWLPVPLSSEVQASLEVNGTGAVFSGLHYYLWWLAPLWIVAGIGLYFFRPWSRWLFIAIYALSLGVCMLGGVYATTPWDSTLESLATLMDGATIALAFLPPLDRLFRGKGTSAR